jgi:pSer/pThr/pTyr-binding forkhead associated (FHA) protein
MTDQVLNILKLALLGLVALFFARVLWAVWSEVREPRQRSANPRVAVASQQAVTQAAPRPTAPSAAVAPSRPGKGGPATRLVMLEPKHRRGTTVALTDEITLGRDPNCTITIDDDTYISQLHLRVYDYEGQPMVEDLGSTNGTFHNGNRLHGSRLLHPGDRIQVGTTVIEAQ